MIRLWMIFWIPVLLSSCGGTQVGNALTVTLSGSDDEFEATAFSLTLAQSIVSEGMLSFRAVAVRPSDDCETSTPDVGSWVIKRENRIFNYLSSNSISFDVNQTADQTICAIRFILGPALSGEHLGKSVYFAGVDSAGNNFTIESEQFHVLALRFPVAQSLGSIRELRALMSRRTALDTLDLSALGSPAILTPVSPIAFRAFLNRLRRALIGHLLSSQGAETPPAAQASALGDENQDTLISGESGE
jgi:hypothetical protein